MKQESLSFREGRFNPCALFASTLDPYLSLFKKYPDVLGPLGSSKDGENKKESNQEFSEAIASHVFVTKEELQEGVSQGFLEIKQNNKTIKAYLRDPFLTFALSF